MLRFTHTALAVGDAYALSQGGCARHINTSAQPTHTRQTRRPKHTADGFLIDTSRLGPRTRIGHTGRTPLTRRPRAATPRMSCVAYCPRAVAAYAHFMHTSVCGGNMCFCARCVCACAVAPRARTRTAQWDPPVAKIIRAHVGDALARRSRTRARCHRLCLCVSRCGPNTQRTTRTAATNVRAVIPVRACACLWSQHIGRDTEGNTAQKR